jgi:2-polyprenyl-6-methoxyphenol hydroxylase-like FAD-dependent oxidoreductase
LISGASITGPALAFWLTRYGINATVVEKSSSLRGGGYPIDVRGTAVEVVERMGLYSRMRAAHVDSKSIGFVDARGTVLAKIDPEAITEGVRGKDIEIRRGDIATILYDETKDATTYRFNDSIATLREHDRGVDVTFAGGGAVTYDIVIGADGLHSNTRSLVFGHESQFERYIGYCFAGFTMPNTFGLDRGALVYTLPGRNAVIYATNDGGPAFAFLVFKYPASPLRKSLTDAGRRELTADMFKGVDGWIVPRMVEAMRKAGDLFFDSVSQIHMPAWSKGRVVLAGDAAHATSFMSGQGSSMALVGAYVLAGEIATKSDHGSAFEAYAKLARPFVEMNQALVDEGKKIMIPDTQEDIDARNEAIRKMAAEAGSTGLRKDSSRQAHGALALPDYG